MKPVGCSWCQMAFLVVWRAIRSEQAASGRCYAASCRSASGDLLAWGGY
jgi:hypothetical protein